LSVRTIQRIESDNKQELKGHTLKALSVALEVESSVLKVTDINYRNTDKLNLKYINLSVFSFFIIPFGNVLFPFILWRRYKKKSSLITQVGKQLINFQLIWTIVLCLSLIIAPFLQIAFRFSFPLLLGTLFFMIFLNVLIVIRTAIRIEKEQLNFFKLPFNFL